MKTSIETYSGAMDTEGRPALVAREELVYDAATAQAINAAELAGTDVATIRVIDDLVAALLAKQILTEADLPPAVHDKLAQRRAIRSRQ